MLKQAEQGVYVSGILHEQNISQSIFYRCKSQYFGMNAALIIHFKDLEAENVRLKKMYTEERLKSDILKDTMLKKGSAL